MGEELGSIKCVGDHLLLLKSFYAGKESGKCIQLTLEDDYIWLRRKEVEILRNSLTEWLDD